MPRPAPVTSATLSLRTFTAEEQWNQSILRCRFEECDKSNSLGQQTKAAPDAARKISPSGRNDSHGSDFILRLAADAGLVSRLPARIIHGARKTHHTM